MFAFRSLFWILQFLFSAFAIAKIDKVDFIIKLELLLLRFRAVILWRKWIIFRRWCFRTFQNDKKKKQKNTTKVIWILPLSNDLIHNYNELFLLLLLTGIAITYSYLIYMHTHIIIALLFNSISCHTYTHTHTHLNNSIV